MTVGRKLETAAADLTVPERVLLSMFTAWRRRRDQADYEAPGEELI
jgi:hypothetical protein